MGTGTEMAIGHDQKMEICVARKIHTGDSSLFPPNPTQLILFLFLAAYSQSI